MPESVDAAVVRRWCAAGLDALRRHRSEIDALNVYPVPDGDTGTNMALTMAAATEAVESTPPSPQTGAFELLAVAARGALLGARGNSGIILAQLLRGLATGEGPFDGPRLAQVLEVAARSAYGAVAAPVEGTVLTVATEAARAAADTVAGASGAGRPALDSSSALGGSSVLGSSQAFEAAAAQAGSASQADTAAQADAAAQAGSGVQAGSGAAEATTEAAGVGAVARAAANGAREALALTPTQLPALARAGVVDAGGRGLVVLLDALVEVLTGDRPPETEYSKGTAVLGGEMQREVGSAEFAYEVQFLLDAPVEAIRPLRAALAALGDSLVIVGDPPTWHVHVHVNDVGKAIEAGVEAGRPSRISVTRFAEQVAAAPTAVAEPEPPAVHRESAVVVVCDGDGLGALLASEGATVLSGTPSTGEVLAAIRSTGAERVVVLPNDTNVLAVANVAAAEARAAGVQAGVVPTRSPVQALAAMAVRDPGRRFEDDVIAMAEAAARCRPAEVTVAAREALTVAGRCQPGDVLAIVDGEVNLLGQDFAATACLLLDRMLTGGGELVTLVVGQGAPEGLAETLRGHVERAWPFVEVQCYEGGQPHYPLLVGVE